MDIKEILRNSFAASHLTPASVRVRLLRLLGLDLGAKTAIASGVTFKGGSVTTGEGCFINHGVYVDRRELRLGNRVYIAPRVMFATRNHEIGQRHKRAGDNLNQPISVGSGTWIGANATILGGVKIASGCIIAAGAVVTKDTKADGLYAGVPAVRIKDLI
ncbi:DapH/DapD/GlmU-related protein [Arthrobacter citreus]|uniref:DapH/DapD/GlmU-related protein n=1 Tax=Arthrobacter citreus TaxID=1670 RepID=A0ABZ2ZSC7_9MICC